MRDIQESPTRFPVAKISFGDVYFSPIPLPTSAVEMGYVKVQAVDTDAGWIHGLRSSTSLSHGWISHCMNRFRRLDSYLNSLGFVICTSATSIIGCVNHIWRIMNVFTDFFLAMPIFYSNVTPLETKSQDLFSLLREEELKWLKFYNTNPTVNEIDMWPGCSKLHFEGSSFIPWVSALGAPIFL